MAFSTPNIKVIYLKIILNSDFSSQKAMAVQRKFVHLKHSPENYVYFMHETFFPLKDFCSPEMQFS